MAKKNKVISDEEIVTRTLAKSKESVGWSDSKLAKERERVTKYLNGQLPARQHEGASSYVSTDVYDAVEMQKAQLLEVFAGGDEIAQFDPDQDMGVADCRAATQYAQYSIFRENDGFAIFQSVIHDGLTARNGLAKVFWEERCTYQEETFDGLSYNDAQALAAQDDVDEFDADAGPDGLFSGTLVRKTDCSRVAINAIAPEEFLIAKDAVSIASASYCGHRTPKTRADLLEMGFDRKKVKLIPTGEDDGTRESAESLARHDPVSGVPSVDAIQPELEPVTLFESYVRMQIDSAKGVRLYKIMHVGNVLLDKQEVDKAPFLSYAPLPVPHVFYGNNFAARVIPTQNARTVLVRGVLDHTSITNNPRWQVVNGGLLNPREMLENRLGGLVNVRRPDSIAPLPQNNLNPYVFTVLSLLKDDKEQLTGTSSLAQGQNKEAISTQNSKGLVDNLVSLSGQRSKISARNFAYGFLVPLMIEVVRLGILNEKAEKIIEVAGGPISVTPKDWTERKTCTVSMHLGYGEKDQAAQKIMGAYEKMAEDASIAHMFTPQNRYAMIRDAMKLSQLNNGAAYITAPDKVTPPGPDPLKTRELDIKEKAVNASTMTAQASIAKVQKSLAIDSTRVENDQHRMQLDAMDKDRTHNRQDLETASRIDVEQDRVEIERRLATHTINTPPAAPRTL